jgi:SAM-dependent methyltransferase
MFAEGDAYERFMGRWSRQFAPQLLRFASVGEGSALLDVGCGTGALASAAAAIPSVRVTSVDKSRALVEHARGHAPGNVRFEVGDAQALSFSDATFDQTVAMLVMNFIPDPASALREMIRVTRSGGIVAAAVWDYGEGMQMLRVFWDEAVALAPDVAARDERHMPLSRAGELSALWRAEGLQDVDEQPLTVALAFASFDDYWQPFIGGQGPAGAYVASLSDAGRRALESRLRGRLSSAGQDSAFTLPARAWAVRGVVPAAESLASLSCDVAAGSSKLVD